MHIMATPNLSLGGDRLHGTPQVLELLQPPPVVVVALLRPRADPDGPRRHGGHGNVQAVQMRRAFQI